MSQAPLMLSVSGMRGLIGRSLTPPVAARFAAAAGQWFSQQQPSGRRPHVVLGRDSRPSGQMIEQAAAAGLLAAGCRVTVLGIVTTPGCAIMAQHLGADGGLVITASHNPIEWNGIKVLRHDGVAPPPPQAQQIIDAFKADRIEYVPVEAIQPLCHDGDAVTVHADLVLQHLDVSAIRSRRLKVVLDSVHGAGGPETVRLLDALGVELIHLYGEPTGHFPHTPEPLAENLLELARTVRAVGADVGFAQDPDADRLAIVDNTGRYIGEEFSLVLGALHRLTQHKQTGGAGAVLAANLSTSRMIDDVAGEFGARVIRTPVGEANVAAAMQDTQALFGGEGNGGMIDPRTCWVRNSLSGIGLILEMLAGRSEPLDRIVAGIPQYAIVKDKVAIQPGMAERISEILPRQFANQQVDLQDGVRIDWPDRWVHVRASNTEPILRLIAEARDREQAEALITEVRTALKL